MLSNTESTCSCDLSLFESNREKAHVKYKTKNHNISVFAFGTPNWWKLHQKSAKQYGPTIGIDCRLLSFVTTAKQWVPLDNVK